MNYGHVLIIIGVAIISGSVAGYCSKDHIVVVKIIQPVEVENGKMCK